MLILFSYKTRIDAMLLESEFWTTINYLIPIIDIMTNAAKGI